MLVRVWAMKVVEGRSFLSTTAKALACGAALTVGQWFAPAQNPEGVDLDRLARGLKEFERWEWKVLSELLCATSIPPAVAEVVFTNIVTPTFPVNSLFMFQVAAQCARFMPSRELLHSAEVGRPFYWDALCAIMARLHELRDEFKPTLERLARSERAEILPRVALAALQRSASGQEEHILKALRSSDELRCRTARAIVWCGASDWVTREIAKELVRLASDGPDELCLFRVSLVLGAIGSRARPVADSLEKAWLKQKAKTGSAPWDDMAVRIALAKMRGRWNERTARPVLREAGTDYGDVRPRAMLWTMDHICGYVLEDRDLEPVFRLIRDNDRRVVLGAARFCELLAGRARGAEPALLDALRQSSDAKIREEVIKAVGAVGRRETEAKLRKTMRAARSDLEREALAEQARIIKETGEILGPLFR